MAKITIQTLKKIISEEIKNIITEGDSEDKAAVLMSNASKLLKAIETFKVVATEKCKVDMGTCVDDMEKVLKRIINSPMQYVDVPKSVVKKVSLKPAEKLI